ESTTIYVTIIPYNAVGSASGCTEESFATETLATVPNCTQLSNPIHNTTDVAVGTDISWNAVAMATGYYLTVGTTSGGNDILDNADVGNVTTYNPPNDLPESTTIYVTIIPYNAVGSASGCTEESFATETLATVPNCTQLSNPIHNTTDVAVGTDISWNAVAMATGYYLTVGTTSGGNDILDNADVGNVTTYNPPNDLPESTTIYVTIIPYNAVGSASGCTEESFATETLATVPNCTQLSNPIHNTTDVAVGTDISWNAVAMATGYYLTVGTTSGGNDILDNADVGNVTTYNPPNDLPESTTIYVTIIPYNAVGSASGCTEESFATILSSTIPECPTVISPSNEMMDVPTNTSISWQALTNVDGYRISMGTSSGQYDIVNAMDVGNITTYQPIDAFPEATDIFLLVEAYNDVGVSNFCEEIQFTTITLATVPECTTLLTPIAGESDVPTTTLLEWNTVEDAEGYYLTVGTSNEGNDILDTVDVGLLTSYQLADELPEGSQIYVSIVPYNSQGEAQGCSSESFTTREELDMETLFGFSPDGDGINDFWEINGIENYPNNTVIIFNRWGDIVFKIDGYDNAGNVFRGEANQLTRIGAGQLPEGTYFFQILIPEEHNLKTTKGFVVLKR
ncbi:MAG: gliding motility-associated C-terminal domain-containing protein, partial [Algicola sp.]|nr:gliding motility-associated C-terminal domain-containing protein [Algicola sp.]